MKHKGSGSTSRPKGSGRGDRSLILTSAAEAVRSLHTRRPARKKTAARISARPVDIIDMEGWEEAALSISQKIQERHLPFGVIMDPICVSPDRDGIVNYTRAGDSAIWTGHYLAAEAFRYKVTESPDALENARVALAGIQSLVDITGTGLLARTLVPTDSRFAEAITREEASNGIFKGKLNGREYFWVGDTSRDQYCGVLFGLAVAHEMVTDPGVRSEIAQLVTRLLEFLVDHHWAVVMPDGRISTVFIGRPDQQLALLQIGRRVNSGRFSKLYRERRSALARFVIVPIAFEVLDDHNSYFKFNLATINLFNLIRWEDSSQFKEHFTFAYTVLRRTTDDHGNAHFNMIDRALKGPDRKRDQETPELLAAWLRRPSRDEFVDLRGTIPSCGQPDRACHAIPVEQRVRTDFLWQRSPFLLVGGGSGLIEAPGIDFILPYWMARFYQVL